MPFPRFSLSLIAALLLGTASAQQPNVLFIAVDDLVPTLGAYGDELAITPEIDALAAQGLTFLNHHVQWAVCGPSRAALTTSLMPEETGVVGFQPIRGILPDLVTLPEHFKNNDYATACAGKFHDFRTVGDPTQPKDGNGRFPDGTAVDDPASWSIPYNSGTGSGFSPAGKPAVDYSDLPDADYVDHSILTMGLNYISTLSTGGKPFFLAVGFKKPHLAFIAPKQYWDLYDTNSDGNYDNDFPLPTHTDPPQNASAVMLEVLQNNNELQRYEPFDVSGLPTPAEVRELRHGYYACVSFIDTLVGQLLSKLEMTPDPVQTNRMMNETTIVIFWGDHGFYLGEQDRWAKHAPTERSTAAPLIIYDPRAPNNGAKTLSPANTIDLFPTLCHLAELPIPDQPLSDTQLDGRPLRGRSLVPVLNDPETMVNGGAISRFNRSGYWGHAYRTERFRYIEWIPSGSGAIEYDLFDFQHKALELADVADDPKYEQILYDLSRALRADPATQAMSRLQNRDPFPEPVNLNTEAFGLEAGMQSGNQLIIDWESGLGGVSYQLYSSDDLGNPWEAQDDPVAQGPQTVTADAQRSFFKVEMLSNLPPSFTADPIVLESPEAGENYTVDIASNVTDPEGGLLNFQLSDAPTWLSLSSTGVLSGTPQAADAGVAYFTISVTDSSGLSMDALGHFEVILNSSDDNTQP